MGSQQWFISDIQHMMHGLGDCRRPLHESAVLVEEITQQQMAALLHKACDVALMRGAKMIGVEDILFLIRRDKVKLSRLLRYMCMKDLRASIQRSASVDEEDSVDSADGKPSQGRKRRKVCHDFLSSIDQTGELLALFNDEVEDEVKHERLLRADLQSRCLDPKQYLEFCEARQCNFSRKYKSQRFKDWLLSGVTLELKPNLHALELFSYLAYETVAQLVDLALMVKQDQAGDVREPRSLTLPSINHGLAEAVGSLGQPNKPGIISPSSSPPTTPTVSGQSPSLSTIPGMQQQQQQQQITGKIKTKKKKKSGTGGLDTLPIQAIQPSDIQEAIRRYSQYLGPFATYMKNNSLSTANHVMLSI